MIPDGWSEVRLGDLGYTFGGLTGKSAKDFGVGSAIFVTFMNVMSNVVLSMEGVELVDVRQGETQNQLRARDVIFNGSSETPEEVGFGATVPDELDGVYLNSFCFGFRCHPDAQLDTEFFAYLTRSPIGRGVIRPMAQGSTRYNITKTNLLNGRFLLPPLAEQQAIAEALSDADALVESLDSLIAKKRDMKQAAMQQLLTGRTRLPGHTDKWTEIDYNELTWHRAGNGSLIKGKVYQESGADRIPAFSASGQDVWCDVAEYTEPGLVISAVGSRCGKVFRASGAWTAIANTHVLFAKEDICSTDFLWLRVNEEKFWVKGGTGQPFVLVRESLKRRELWPNRDEQVQIAQVLMDMDAEIDALVAQREKAELLKQGMMQELLSGRVRLV